MRPQIEERAQRIVVVQIMARASGVTEDEADRRLTRIESDPRLLDAHRHVNSQIGDSIVTNIDYNEHGAIEVTVAPMARGLAPEAGGRNLRKLDALSGTFHAEQALRRQIAAYEVRATFGRAPVTALPLLVSARLS
jgi:hypothetical protein